MKPAELLAKAASVDHLKQIETILQGEPNLACYAGAGRETFRLAPFRGVGRYVSSYYCICQVIRRLSGNLRMGVDFLKWKHRLTSKPIDKRPHIGRRGAHSIDSNQRVTDRFIGGHRSMHSFRHQNLKG